MPHAQGKVTTTTRKSRTSPCTTIAITISTIVVVIFAIILARRMLRQPKTRDSSNKVQEGVRMYGPTMMGVFKHKARPQAEWDNLDDWRIWIKEAKADIPPYPKRRFSGQGIVICAGGLERLTQAYVNIRVIRDTLHSKLPIEVYYAGDIELTPAIAQYMHAHLDNVKFIDIYSIPDIPANISMNGYQIKPVAIFFSSFEEVLMLDADNIPAIAPELFFSFEKYKQYGAVFWPEWCNQQTGMREAFDVFGLPQPQHWYPYSDPTARAAWFHCVIKEKPSEMESGQVLLNKRRVWRGLSLTVFINVHHRFFLSATTGPRQGHLHLCL